jgi:tetratricopeptide (TPR) repeat protein
MRARSHQLETESRTAFAQVVPSSWVVREVVPDYGVDAQVEIFEEDGAPTGLVFAVQLKATDSDEQIPPVRLSHEKVAYYRSLPDPLLIVRYMSRSATLYTRWLHSFDPYYETTTDAGIVLRFSLEEAWTTGTPSAIRREVEAFRFFRSPALPLPIALHVVTEEPTVHGRTAAEWLVALRAIAEPAADVIDLRGDPPTALGASLILRANAVVVSLGGTTSATFHVEDELAPEALEALPFDSLVTAALALNQAGHIDLASRLLRAFAPASRSILLPQVGFLAASVFAAARRVREALDVAEAVALREEPEADAAATAVALAALNAAPHMTPDERTGYDDFHRKRIARAEVGRVNLGSAHYNYANHLRTSGRPRLAIRQYRLAAKFDPGYRERPYFWRELGSSLYLEGRYADAAAALGKAVALDDYPRTRALHGDALMFAGQFRAAEEVFSSYLDDHPPGAAEWRLKRQAVAALRSDFGDASPRDPARAVALVEEAQSSPTEEALRAALVVDPLCGLGWFNLGVLLVGEEPFARPATSKRGAMRSHWRSAVTTHISWRRSSKPRTHSMAMFFLCNSPSFFAHSQTVRVALNYSMR